MENAQDLIFFLRKFLYQKTDAEISNFLLQTYKNLEIEKIAKKINRKIFAADDAEIIEFIALFKKGNLTAEQILNVKKQFENQENFTKMAEKFGEKKEEKIEILDENVISNAKKFKNFLENLEISTKKMSFKTTRKNGIRDKIIFENGEFAGEKVAGEFQYSTQFFNFFRVGKAEMKNFHERFLANFLAKIAREKKSENENSRVEKVEKIIPQKTTKAIIERELVQKIFEKNLEIYRKNIEILDENLTKFQISGARAGEISLDFVFEKNAEKIKKLKISKNKKEIFLRDKIFELKNFSEKLRAEIEKYFSEK